MASPSIWKEFFLFIREEKKWWMIPLIVVILIIGSLLVFAGNSALAPFIYPFF